MDAVRCALSPSAKCRSPDLKVVARFVFLCYVLADCGEVNGTNHCLWDSRWVKILLTRNLPARAYPEAGGPVPSNAQPPSVIRELTTGTQIAVLKSPTQNIGCELWLHASGLRQLNCGVHSLIRLRPFNQPDDILSNWFVYVTPEQRVVHKGDLPHYESAQEPGAKNAYVPAQILDYGQVLSFHGMVCASAFDGMTCWDSTTGKGAVMYREYVEFFG